MNFDQLLYLVEADDLKAGQRYFNAQNAEGPSGVASSPIGRRDYNPEIARSTKVQPADRGFRDDKYVNSILRNTIRLLKTRKSFYPGLQNIFQQFNDARVSVPAEVEKDLRVFPNLIDRYYSKLYEKENLLNQIRANPEHKTNVTEDILLNGDGEYRLIPSKDPKTGKPTSKKILVNPGINDLKAIVGKFTAKYKGAQALVQNVVSDNEKAAELFKSRVAKYIQDNIAALVEELNDEYAEELKSVAETQTLTDFNQINDALAEKATGDASVNDIVQKIAVMNKLAADIEAGHGIIDTYLELMQNSYEESKPWVFDRVANGESNINEVISKLYDRLPLNRLKDFFNRIKDEAPIKLPSRDYIRKTKGATTVGEFLKQIAPGDLDAKQDEIIGMITRLPIDDFRKKAAIAVLGDPKSNPALKIKKLNGMIGGIKREAGYAQASGTYTGPITFGESFKTFNKTVLRYCR